jgi:hypothetical protein
MTEAVAAPQICTKAEFARLNGWGKSYVSKLGLEGRLVLTADERVDVAASLARIQATTGAPERGSPPAVSQAMQDLQVRGKQLEVERQEREAAKEKGELLERSEVETVVASACVEMLAVMERSIETIASKLATNSADEFRFKEIVRDELAAVCIGLSSRFKTLSRDALQ